jgi:hypothetical protein
MKKIFTVLAFVFCYAGALARPACAGVSPIDVSDETLEASDATTATADVANAASDAANATDDSTTATKTTTEVSMLTSAIDESATLSALDAEALRNPMPEVAALPAQLVTQEASSPDAKALYEANTTEATTDSSEKNREGEMLAVASNLDGAALSGLKTFELQDAQDSAAKDLISNSDSSESLLATNAVLARQGIIEQRQVGQMEAIDVLAVDQQLTEEAMSFKSQADDHDETAALFTAP